MSKRLNPALVAAALLLIDKQQRPKPAPGELGKTPAHEWDGTKVRFEKNDGSFGEWIDLVGKPAEAPGEETLALLVKQHLDANPPLPGEPGKDAAPISETMIAAAVAEYMLAHPAKPGEPGHTPTEQELTELVMAVVIANAEMLKGSDGLTPSTDDILQLCIEAVIANAELLRGPPGKDADQVEQKPGPRGVGIKRAEIDYAGHLILYYTDGTKQDVGPVREDWRLNGGGLGFTPAPPTPGGKIYRATVSGFTVEINKATHGIDKPSLVSLFKPDGKEVSIAYEIRPDDSVFIDSIVLMDDHIVVIR